MSPVLPLLLASSSHADLPSLPPPLSFTLRLSPAISGPHAGQAVPHPERLITLLPPAVYTSVLAATPIHYLPWSRAAHSSPLSATASFTARTPSRGGARPLSETRWLLIRTRTRRGGSRPNPTAGITSFYVFLWALVYDAFEFCHSRERQ